MAVRVTVVPLTYDSVQSLPQSIPAGLDVTTPLPGPAVATLNVKTRAKLAVTD